MGGWSITVSNDVPIVTLDIIAAPTNRAKCHHCKIEIKKGVLKGVIYVEVDFTNPKTGEASTAYQNRSLCKTCVQNNINGLSNHLNNLTMKLGK